MATKQRHKSPALPVQAAQSKQDVVENIRVIGDLTREKNRLQADMNDAIAALQEQYATDTAPINARIASLQTGVQTWCEANRDVLTEGGKVKFADFVTGVVKWRVKPPSVSIKGMDAVIALLKQSTLTRFVRVKEEVNKEAILNEPDAVRGIAGISINTGVEEFVIEPAEQSLENA